MNGLKATIIFCATIVILFISNMVFQKYYAPPDVWMTNTEKGIYVFDKQTSTLQFCSTEVECSKIELVKTDVLLAKNNKVIDPKSPKSKKSKKSDIKDTSEQEKENLTESQQG